MTSTRVPSAAPATPLRDAHALRRETLAGDASAGSAVDSAIARADEVEKGPLGINAFITLDREHAREQAANVPAMMSDTEPGALIGVPIAVSDDIVTTTLPTTCGSRMLERYVSPYDATVITCLRDAGAVILGKTNLDEFGLGFSTEESAFGAARNPADRGRTPGGPAGGAAAAVAAGIVPIAIASESGGSLRQPAAFCGVVGVKPTYGRVSRFGLVSCASSLEQVGVLAASVADAACALRAMSGHDKLDSTSADIAAPEFGDAQQMSVQGLVVGVPKEYFPITLDAGVRARCDAIIARLVSMGAVIREVSMPHTELALPAHRVIVAAEAASNLARFDAMRFGTRATGGVRRNITEVTRAEAFGHEVMRQLLFGTWLRTRGSGADILVRARQARTLVADDFRRVFSSGVQLLFTPTTPSSAFSLGAARREDPTAEFTAAASLAGVPAMSLPIGTAAGLPIGGQIMAPHFDEVTMLGAAFALERAMGVEAAQ